MSNLFNRDIISIKDLSSGDIDLILSESEKLIDVAEGNRKLNYLSGRILATAFFEPSTRTRLSFETAMHRLGGSVIGFAESKSTSTSKGETLADTIRVLSTYSDAIVIRHPNEGSARLAADYSDKPVINAGDGASQHPTQTLLDLFTIKREFGKLENLKVGIIGDLKYGRTVHSLSYALSMFGIEILLSSPSSLTMPPDVMEYCKTKTKINDVKLDYLIEEADVVYVTRIQKERFPDEEEYQSVSGSYKITRSHLIKAKSHMIIMHPLPRVDEISTDVDNTLHARYFRQSFYGVPVRMAILNIVLGGDVDG
ncbi:MAG: aspartate carbamoyltransferase [Candidatus Thermoplasmatota archaeon]|jgi:aspartate carbamoyltransferase catalytic subunit|nr:aspartate carbamoyltransferase [Candidatus Thermoplasmatota archaeon]MCL5962865.1 aspartate carbamoyltransferase [Candidatus Thermoplasmatota archaeon]